MAFDDDLAAVSQKECVSISMKPGGGVAASSSRSATSYDYLDFYRKLSYIAYLKVHVC